MCTSISAGEWPILPRGAVYSQYPDGKSLGSCQPLRLRSWAADLQVVCPGGGPGVYPSINAALSALDSQGPNSITVAGTCAENIFLDKRERLVIQAAPGQTATIRRRRSQRHRASNVWVSRGGFEQSRFSRWRGDSEPGIKCQHVELYAAAKFQRRSGRTDWLNFSY